MQLLHSDSSIAFEAQQILSSPVLLINNKQTRRPKLSMIWVKDAERRLIAQWTAQD